MILFQNQISTFSVTFKSQKIIAWISLDFFFDITEMKKKNFPSPCWAPITINIFEAKFYRQNRWFSGLNVEKDGICETYIRQVKKFKEILTMLTNQVDWMSVWLQLWISWTFEFTCICKFKTNAVEISKTMKFNWRWRNEFQKTILSPLELLNHCLELWLKQCDQGITWICFFVFSLKGLTSTYMKHLLIW